MRLGKIEAISPHGLRIEFEAVNGDSEIMVHQAPELGLNIVRDTGLPPHIAPVGASEGKTVNTQVPRMIGQVPLDWTLILHWDFDKPVAANS